LKIKNIVLAITLIAMAPLAWSQGAFRYGSNERAEKWDFSLVLINQGSESLSGPADLSLAINDDWGFGFNFAYNLTNHWALGFEMNWVSPKYTLSGTDEDGDFRSVRHQMDMFNGQLTGTFNLLEGPITPFATLSVGFSYLDSNIKDGPGYCYPDWYWGWVCYSSSHDSTELNYGVGLGLRWDINRDMFLRASYSVMALDISNTSDPSFGMGRMEIGWKF